MEKLRFTLKRAAAAMLFAACLPAAQAATYVYVSNADSQDISTFTLDQATGALSPIETVHVGGTAMPMTVSPNRRRLYVALRSKPYRVANFAINPIDGKLIALGDSPLADSMAYLSVDKTGRYLFSASYGGNKVSVNPIGPDGIVGAPQQSIATGPMAHAIAASPDNRYVFATVLGADVWLRFAFDAQTGQLVQDETPAQTLPAKSGPRFFAYSPDKRFVYLVDELDGNLHVLAFNQQTDTVKLSQTVSALPTDFANKFGGKKPWASDVHVTPDGRYVYTSERSSSTIEGYRVNPRNGELTRIGEWPTETQPRGFNIDSSGRYLLAVGEKSAHLSTYRIGKDGNLTPLQRYAVGRGPNWIELVDYQ